MSKNYKLSHEEKVKIITEYLDGTYGFCALCRIYGICQQTLKRWIRIYKIFGFDGLNTMDKKSYYSDELKQAAINDYLSNKLTILEIMKKYKVRSEKEVRYWIKKYNSHEAINTSEIGGIIAMTNSRQTTLPERIEVAQYCITNGYNYKDAAEKYSISYQQARNYTKKYKMNGTTSLEDRRGKHKSEDEMNEIEKLRLENKVLRKQKERAEMEIAFLKKLKEIERRED